MKHEHKSGMRSWTEERDGGRANVRRWKLLGNFENNGQPQILGYFDSCPHVDLWLEQCIYDVVG